MTTTNADTKIAVLEANMTNIAKDIADIKADIKAIVLQMNRQPSLEAEVLALKEEILEIKKTSSLWRWLAPTLTALFTAAVTFLLINYLQRI
jgi:hypothetical protein